VKFDISKFEVVFYNMLYTEHCLDASTFDRKVCYQGRVLQVKMENSRIILVIDLSGQENITLYKAGALCYQIA